MPSEQRLHPLSILFAFAGSLKTFALPGLLVLFAGRSSSGGSDGMFGRLSPNWEVWMMLLLIPAALAAIARYLSFRVRYESSDLIIRSGIVFKNERHIPYSRIQNLEAVRNVFHRAFGVVEVRVENASGKETEARISVLPLAAFEEMRRRVFEGKSRGTPHATADTDASPASLPPSVAAPHEVTLLHLPLRELLLCGFLENRGLVVVGAIYGFFWEFGPIGGFWNRIVDEGSYGSGFVRDTVRSVLEGGAPPFSKLAVVAAGVIGFLLVVRVISMAWAVVRLYGFRLTRAGEDLRTEYGLFTRVAATIPLGRIQTMTIREGPLHRRLGRVAVRVETAGGAPAKGGPSVDREWLAPLVRVEALPSLVREVIPELDVAAIEWRPVHPRAFRRAVKPSMIVALAVPAALAAAIGWWALAVLPVSMAWFAFAARKHVDHLAWSDTGEVAVFRSGWLWRVRTIARVAKIQAVTVKESPFDRRTAMARVRVDTAGANERSVRVDIPYLPRETAAELHHRLAAGAARTDFRW